MKRLHICLFSPSCWSDWLLYGMPMRVYWHGDEGTRFWTLLGKKRTKKLWDEADQVRLDIEERRK